MSKAYKLKDESHISTKTLSVSIVVYSSHAVGGPSNDPILTRLLADLNQLSFCEKIVVLDNSPHAYFSWTSNTSPKITYLHFSGSNLGYGRANNVARFITDSTYHLICNPDITFVELDCLPRLVDMMEADKQLAMVQPLIVSPDGRDIQNLCKQNPTFLSQVGRGLLGWPYKKIFSSYERWYEMANIAYGDKAVESQYLSGCFMLCRRSFLDEIDWFDPRFFMYLEDADLTRRLSNIGRCLHEPSLRIGHVWGRGSHRKLRLKLVAITSYFLYSAKWGFQWI